MFRRGRRINDRLLENEARHNGRLSVAWVVDAQRHRLVHYATLVELTEGGMGKPVIPDLLDPVLMGVSHSRMSLSGFECVDGGEHRQTWLIDFGSALKANA